MQFQNTPSMGPLSFPSPTDTLRIVLTTRSGLFILQKGSLQLAIPLEAISQTSSRLSLDVYPTPSRPTERVHTWTSGGPCELWATRHNVAAPLAFALPVLQTSSDIRARSPLPQRTIPRCAACVSLCVLTRGPRAISIDHLKSNPHGGPHRGITAVTGERKLKSFLSETNSF